MGKWIKCGLTAQIVFSFAFGMIRSLPTHDEERLTDASSMEPVIDICDFNGAEIDFPQTSKEAQSIFLTYAWNSSSDCNAFLGLSLDMHFKLEIVSFYPHIGNGIKAFCENAHPTLQMMQMRDVINLSNPKEFGHSLRVTDLCKVFEHLNKHKKPLPHSFQINRQTIFKNILGLRLTGRYGGPGFELRLTRVPAPIKATIKVPIESPVRLQCWGGCPFNTAKLLFVDESDPDGTPQDFSNRLRTETIPAGKTYSILKGIDLEGEAKGFRRSCSGRGSGATVAKLFKFNVIDAVRKAGTYIFKFGDRNICTFVIKAGGK